MAKSGRQTLPRKSAEPHSFGGRAYVLGVDGGGTKTQAVILDARGRVAGEGLAGPSNPLRVGVSSAAAAVREAFDRARLRPAAVHPEDECRRTQRRRARASQFDGCSLGLHLGDAARPPAGGLTLARKNSCNCSGRLRIIKTKRFYLLDNRH